MGGRGRRGQRWAVGRWGAWLGVAAVMGVVIGAAGCVSNPQPDIPQDAVVSYDTVKATFPGEDLDSDLPQLEEDTARGALRVRAGALVGDVSGTRAVILDTMRATNGLIFQVVRLLELVSEQPPAAAGVDVTEWRGQGPRRQTRFILGRQGEPAESPPGTARFDYRLDIRPNTPNGVFRSLMEGFFDRAPTQTEPGRRLGQGLLRLKLDTLRAFDGAGPSGSMEVAFRRRGGVLQVVGYLRQVQQRADDEPRSGAIRYTVLSSGGGEAELIAKGDVVGDGVPLEVVAIQAVWGADGAGRAAIAVTGGSLSLSLIHI